MVVQEEKAIEVTRQVLNRCTVGEIAGHLVCEPALSRFRDANGENCDLLSNAFGLSSRRQPKRQPKRQPETSQCTGENSLRTALAGKGVKEPHITARVHHLLRATQVITDVVKYESYDAELHNWNQDPPSFWRIQVNDIFSGEKNDGIDCIRSLYCGLDRVQQDDYASATRRRFILILLTMLRDCVPKFTAPSEKFNRGQDTRSSVLDWMTLAIWGMEDRFAADFPKKRKELVRQLKAGNQYIQLTKFLGKGVLFCLGGMSTCRLSVST